MKEKKKFFLGVLVGILIMGVLTVGFVKLAFESRIIRTILFDTVKKLSVVTTESAGEKKDTTTGAAINWNEVRDKSEELYKAIDDYYLNEIDNNKLKDGMYKGMVDSLGDQYTVYYNAEEYKQFTTSSSGTYCGIGVVVSQNASTGAITIVKTFKKGSGEKEGMLPGDIIYKVNGEKIEGLELSKVVTKIKGEEGTFVKVTVLRDNKEIEFNLERKKLEIDTVTYRMEEKDGKKIGYIAVTEFDEVTASQFKNGIAELEKEGMEGLVIDLRDNPGGLLDVTCEMLDRMIKKGLLVYTVDKNGKRVDEEATDNLSFDKPVAILVNGNSASASEVFSGAMKDYKAATLVGTKTFGKGIVQSIVPFGDGTAMKVTVSKYYTPMEKPLREYLEDIMGKMRLVTRSDFDGLVCAMILKELDIIDEIKFVHPKDVQDGKVDLTENDITTNLPYDPRVGLAFDHHESELSRVNAGEASSKFIIDGYAKSAARVVYDYYGGAERIKRVSAEIMEAVDKGDSADFTVDDILEPEGWTLLNYVMDARTGLGRFHDFKISNYDLMMELIDYCLIHPIQDILALPDVKERVDLYFEQQELFKEQLKRLVKIEGKVAVIDLRNEETIYAGNRFMVYAMYPDTEISVHIAWGFKKQNTAVMIGKSIVNKDSNVNIGDICLEYGGGGHANAGTCQLDNDKVDNELPKIIEKLNK